MNIDNNIQLNELLELIEISDQIWNKLIPYLSLPYDSGFDTFQLHRHFVSLAKNRQYYFLRNSLVHRTELSFLNSFNSQMDQMIPLSKLPNHQTVKLCANVGAMETILRKKLQEVVSEDRDKIELLLPTFYKVYELLKSKIRYASLKRFRRSPFRFQTYHEQNESLSKKIQTKQCSLTRPSTSNPIKHMKKANQRLVKKPKKRMSSSLHIFDLHPHPRETPKRCSTAFLNKIPIKKNVVVSTFNPGYENKEQKEEQNKNIEFQSESEQLIKEDDKQRESIRFTNEILQTKNIQNSRNSPSSQESHCEMLETKKNPPQNCRRAVLKRRGSCDRGENPLDQQLIEKIEKSIKFAEEHNLNSKANSLHNNLKKSMVKPKLKRKNKHTILFPSNYKFKQQHDDYRRFYTRTKDRIKEIKQTRIKKRKKKANIPKETNAVLPLSSKSSKVVIKIQTQKTQKNNQSKREKSSHRSHISISCRHLQKDELSSDRKRSKQTSPHRLIKKNINKSEYFATKNIVEKSPYHDINAFKNQFLDFRQKKECEKASIFFWFQEQFGKKENLKLQRFIMEKALNRDLNGGQTFVIPSHISNERQERITKNHRDFIFEADEIWLTRLRDFKSGKLTEDLVELPCL